MKKFRAPKDLRDNDLNKQLEWPDITIQMLLESGLSTSVSISSCSSLQAKFCNLLHRFLILSDTSPTTFKIPDIQ